MSVVKWFKTTGWPRRLLTLLSVTLVLMLVLAACGGDEPEEAEATAESLLSPTEEITEEEPEVGETLTDTLEEGEAEGTEAITGTVDEEAEAGEALTGTEPLTDTLEEGEAGATEAITGTVDEEAGAGEALTDTQTLTGTLDEEETDFGATTTETTTGTLGEDEPEFGQTLTDTTDVTGTVQTGETVTDTLEEEPEAQAQEALTPTLQTGATRQVTPTTVVQPGEDLPRDISVQLVKVADGLIDPVNVVSPRDGSGRLFVVERPGRVRIVQDGELLEEPFLDITDQVLSAFLEQGLYDIEFHPDFADNGRFYVHFAELLRNGDSMIVEYQVSADDPNLADPESARVIMQIEQPWANHNGGELAFGPDGYLYIGSGDGGWEGDPLEAGQDLSTLLGKLLRIDVDTEDGQPYAIPPDNPFADQEQLVQLFDITEEEFAQIHTEARPEIWAYGLRNPWKFNFDPETGDLYLPDVGQNHWEEINFQPADSQGGQNYGWDFLMGSQCFPIEAEQCAQVGVLPIAEYSHDLGCAVVGVGVYRGDEFADMDGVYFASDYCSGRIWGLEQGEDGNWAFEELLDPGLQITGAGQDEDGNLYVTSCNCNYGGPDPFENPPGALWQIVPAEEVPDDAETAPLEGETPEAEGTEAEETPEAEMAETPEAEVEETATPELEPEETPTSDSELEASPTPEMELEETGTPEATGTPDAMAGGEEVTIDLAAEDLEFDTDTITVPAGAHVIVTFTNNDVVGHNLAVYETQSVEDEIFVGEIITGPDETITYEFDAPEEPGTYFFRCDLHPFMNGDFIVE